MSATDMDRPRPGGNQFGAGSPSAVLEEAVERFSMTDTAVEPGAWVPRLGDSTTPAGHADLIRGLYRLAAWVADHPEIPAPVVEGRIFEGSFEWDAECRVADRVALALGVEPEYRAGGDHYTAESNFGPVRLHSTAITRERIARLDAYTSYADNVRPDADVVDATVAGGAR